MRGRYPRGRGGGPRYGGMSMMPPPMMMGPGSGMSMMGPMMGAGYPATSPMMRGIRPMNNSGAGPQAVGQPTPRPPFDLALCEPMFPRVNEFDDSALNQALIKRNEELSPTTTEQTNVMNLVTKIVGIIEKLVLSPDTFSAAAIEEIKQVGSLKKGTMLAKQTVGDLSVVLKTLPTIEAVTALGNKIVEELKNAEPREGVSCVSKEFGCEISTNAAVVRLLITTVPANISKLDKAIHIHPEVCRLNMAAIRHARYLDEQASHSSIKVLVRILKDIKRRYAQFQPLNVWILELLAYYAIMNTPNHQPLPLNQAFRRCFQLLSAGIFLPGSAGIVDPCEPSGIRVHSAISLEEQDEICAAAQTLLRVLSHGGYRAILDLEKGYPNLASDMSVWNGVVVSPLEKVYEATMDEINDCVDQTIDNSPPQIPSLVEMAAVS